MFLQRLEGAFRRRVRERWDSIPTQSRSKVERVLDVLMISRRMFETKSLATIKELSYRTDSTTPQLEFKFNREIGFGVLNILSNDFLDRLYTLAETQKREAQAGKITKSNSKEYLQQIYSLAMIDQQNLFLIEDFLTPKMILGISDYFNGKLPLLYDFSVFYSPPRESFSSKWEGSQLFHRDGEGTQNLKIWILCEDTNEEDGPTQLIDASSSALISEEIGYVPGSKISDEVVHAAKHYKNSVKFSAIGKKGTTFYTDTCRSFHFGSRTKSDTSRLVAMYHFIDNNSTYCLPYISKTFRNRKSSLSQPLLNLRSKNPMVDILLSGR